MKLKVFIAIILTVFFSIKGIFAQEITLKWAGKIKTKSNINILGGKKGKYYTTHIEKNNQLKGRIYDDNMNLLEEKDINFSLAKKKYRYEDAYFIEGKLLHFIKDIQRKRGKVSMYAGFSDADLNTSTKLFVLDEVEDRKKVLNFGLRSISPDSTKILTYHELKGRGKNPNKLVFKVYNSSLSEVISEGIYSIPVKSKNYRTALVKVDNFGNVYLLAEIDKERKEKQKGFSKYYFKVIVFAKNKSVKEFDFDYEGNNISFFDMIPSKDNKFFCTGFLSNLKGGRSKFVSDEMFFVKLDCKTTSMEKSKMIKIDELYPEKLRSKDYIPYKVRDIFEKTDGGFSIVAEQYNVRVYQSKYGTSYTYYYCDVVCVQTDKNLEVTSTARIPKMQINARNPSVISTFKDDKTYIVYEDIASNLNVTNVKKLKKNKGSILKSRNKNALFILTINKDGKSKKEIIYNYRESKIKPFILGSLNLTEGKILLSGNDQLGVISIK